MDIIQIDKIIYKDIDKSIVDILKQKLSEGYSIVANTASGYWPAQLGYGSKQLTLDDINDLNHLKTSSEYRKPSKAYLEYPQGMCIEYQIIICERIK